MFLQQQLQTFAGRLRTHDIPLSIRLNNGSEIHLGDSPVVTIVPSSVTGLRHLLNPSMGKLGEAYVEGQLDIEGSIMDVVDVVARLSEKAGKSDILVRDPVRATQHDKKADADAIAYHYDVSNEFYALWLDSGMNYSCAYFRHADDSLEIAQQQKIEHILRKLCLREGDTLLDIGCGWGALIMHAAAEYGANALGVTLSKQQYQLANERIRERGLQDRCEVRLQDYRDVDGCYDRIVSVGMLEHVGLKNLRGYFDKITGLLADDGLSLIHGITSSDPASREVPLKAGDFIDRYVFPNGELPHISFLIQKMDEAGLESRDVENLRPHYAMTLRHWSERFEAASETIRKLVDAKSYRIWRTYLAGSCYAFMENWIAVYQVLASKARPGRFYGPLTREYMYSSEVGHGASRAD